MKLGGATREERYNMTSTVPEYPSPRKILTSKFLRQIWKLSKDAQHGSKKAAGIDKTTPIKYQEELHRNLDGLSQSLTDGTFDFQKLKAALVDKGNGKKELSAFQLYRIDSFKGQYLTTSHMIPRIKENEI